MTGQDNRNPFGSLLGLDQLLQQSMKGTLESVIATDANRNGVIEGPEARNAPNLKQTVRSVPGLVSPQICENPQSVSQAERETRERRINGTITQGLRMLRENPTAEGLAPFFQQPPRQEYRSPYPYRPPNMLDAIPRGFDDMLSELFAGSIAESMNTPELRRLRAQVPSRAEGVTIEDICNGTPTPSRRTPRQR